MFLTLIISIYLKNIVFIYLLRNIVNFANFIYLSLLFDLMLDYLYLLLRNFFKK